MALHLGCILQWNVFLNTKESSLFREVGLPLVELRSIAGSQRDAVGEKIFHCSSTSGIALGSGCDARKTVHIHTLPPEVAQMQFTVHLPHL